jgi:hypothetical protein
MFSEAGGLCSRRGFWPVISFFLNISATSPSLFAPSEFSIRISAFAVMQRIARGITLPNTALDEWGFGYGENAIFNASAAVRHSCGLSHAGGRQ